MGKWTKHADWQPLPKIISKNLPVCPLCKKRTTWEVYDKFGWTTRGYRIVCGRCGAEWEYIISKPRDLLFGGAIAALSRVGKITNDDSIWVLKKTGDNPKAHQLLNKDINFSTWKQMVGSFCGNCGEPLASDEKFCPKCGAKRE